MNLTDAWQTYIRSPYQDAPGAKQLASYKSQWFHFVDWAASEGVTEVEAVDKRVARDYAALLIHDMHVTASTFNRRLATIKRILRIAASEMDVEMAPPFAAIPNRTHHGKTHRPFKKEEIAAIFDAVPDGEKRTILIIALNTGLRLKDCVLLKWECVDREAKLLRVLTFKKQKSVVIPLMGALISELDTLTQDGKYICPGEAQRYHDTPDGYRQWFGRLLKRKGVYEDSTGTVGMHSFRHTFASKLRNAGVSEFVAQSILGHSSSSVTKIYSHIDTASIEQAIQQVEDADNV